MLFGLCFDVRPGNDNDHGDPHEPPANAQRMRLHTKDQDLYLLFGVNRSARLYWRR